MNNILRSFKFILGNRGGWVLKVFRHKNYMTVSVLRRLTLANSAADELEEKYTGDRDQLRAYCTV